MSLRNLRKYVLSIIYNYTENVHSLFDTSSSQVNQYARVGIAIILISFSSAYHIIYADVDAGSCQEIAEQNMVKCKALMPFLDAPKNARNITLAVVKVLNSVLFA